MAGDKVDKPVRKRAPRKKKTDVVVYLKQHIYDQLTGFCTKCGQAKDWLEETGWEVVECPGGEGSNLLAMSHLRRHQLMAEKVNKALAKAVEDAG